MMCFKRPHNYVYMQEELQAQMQQLVGLNQTLVRLMAQQDVALPIELRSALEAAAAGCAKQQRISASGSAGGFEEDPGEDADKDHMDGGHGTRSLSALSSGNARGFGQKAPDVVRPE
jgi:hypothetical protein